jgi:hypothetical protein
MTGPNNTCLDLTLSADDVTSLEAELSTFGDNIKMWSKGALSLELNVHVLPRLATSMSSVYDRGLWLAPWDIKSIVTPAIAKNTSFIIESSGLHDPAGLHLSPPACGSTFAGEYGIGGAGYSYVPRTGNSAPFECGVHGSYEIEWMHQVHFALDNLNGYHDLYGTSFPPCGQGDANPRLWFPDPDPNIRRDPDSPICGTTNPISNDQAMQHVLSTHWPGQSFVANHCRDGVKDYGESGVDSGGNCLP